MQLLMYAKDEKCPIRPVLQCLDVRILLRKLILYENSIHLLAVSFDNGSRSRFVSYHRFRLLVVFSVLYSLVLSPVPKCQRGRIYDVRELKQLQYLPRDVGHSS